MNIIFYLLSLNVNMLRTILFYGLKFYRCNNATPLFACACISYTLVGLFSKCLPCSRDVNSLVPFSDFISSQKKVVYYLEVGSIAREEH